MEQIEATVTAHDEDHFVAFRIAELDIRYTFVPATSGRHEPREPAHLVLEELFRTDVKPRQHVTEGPLLEWAKRHLEAESDALLARAEWWS